MIIVVLVVFLNLFATVFNFLLLARVIGSWFIHDWDANFVTRLLFGLTEPVLQPLRKLLPNAGMMDLSPLAAFIILEIIVVLVNRLIVGV